MGTKMRAEGQRLTGNSPITCKSNLSENIPNHDPIRTHSCVAHAREMLPTNVLGTAPGKVKWSYYFSKASMDGANPAASQQSGGALERTGNAERTL